MEGRMDRSMVGRKDRRREGLMERGIDGRRG